MSDVLFESVTGGVFLARQEAEVDLDDVNTDIADGDLGHDLGGLVGMLLLHSNLDHSTYTGQK